MRGKNMYRFYVSKEQIAADKIYIEGTDVNHIKNVLRLEKGDWIIACDKEGTDYISRINTLSSEQFCSMLKKCRTQIQNFRVRLCIFREFPKKIRWNLSYRKLWN